MVEEYDGTQKLGDTVVRFTAEWCVPCRKYGPLFSRASEKSDENWLSVDVDAFPAVAQEYKVMSIPAVFDQGERVKNYMDWTRERL